MRDTHAIEDKIDLRIMNSAAFHLSRPATTSCTPCPCSAFFFALSFRTMPPPGNARCDISCVRVPEAAQLHFQHDFLRMPVHFLS